MTDPPATPAPPRPRPPAHRPRRRCTAATPSWVHAIRAGLTLVLAWPILTLTYTHLAAHHTLHGLPDTLLTTALTGTLTWAGAALHDPAPAIAQTLLLALITTAARPHPHRHRHRHRY